MLCVVPCVMCQWVMLWQTDSWELSVPVPRCLLWGLASPPRLQIWLLPHLSSTSAASSLSSLSLVLSLFPSPIKSMPLRWRHAAPISWTPPHLGDEARACMRTLMASLSPWKHRAETHRRVKARQRRAGKNTCKIVSAARGELRKSDKEGKECCFLRCLHSFWTLFHIGSERSATQTLPLMKCKVKFQSRASLSACYM